MSTPDLAALTGCVADALRGILAQQGKPVPPTLDGNTTLFGPGGLLDSMGLVTLIVEVEQALADRFALTMTLADDRAMSQRSSPFRTVGTLAEYILNSPKAPHAG